MVDIWSLSRISGWMRERERNQGKLRKGLSFINPKLQVPGSGWRSSCCRLFGSPRASCYYLKKIQRKEEASQPGKASRYCTKHSHPLMASINRAASSHCLRGPEYGSARRSRGQPWDRRETGFDRPLPREWQYPGGQNERRSG